MEDDKDRMLHDEKVRKLERKRVFSYLKAAISDFDTIDEKDIYSEDAGKLGMIMVILIQADKLLSLREIHLLSGSVGKITLSEIRYVIYGDMIAYASKSFFKQVKEGGEDKYRLTEDGKDWVDKNIIWGVDS